MSVITKDEVKAILAGVRQNRALLAACPGHAFARMEPDKVFSKWRCTVCGGMADATEVNWYEKGRDHGRKAAVARLADPAVAKLAQLRTEIAGVERELDAATRQKGGAK